MYHIVFNADERYIKYTAVVINSIIKHTAPQIGGGGIPQHDKSRIRDSRDKSHESKLAPYHFHILSDFISQATRNKLDSFIDELSQIYPCQISIHTFDDEIFHGFRPWGFEYEHSKNYLAYYRLLFARFLPDNNATKCLYLDTDMLVLGDVRELWNIDLGNHILASSCGYTSENAKWDRTLQSTRDSKIHTFEVPYYFCSGLMFINITQWKAQNIESKCLDFLQKYRSEFADQDALNIVIKGDIVRLPPKYGLLIFQAGIELNNPKCDFKDKLQATLQNLKIAHLNGPSHPWLSKYHWLDTNAKPIDYPYTKEWWDIALDTPIFCDELREIYQKIHSVEHEFSAYTKGVAGVVEQTRADLNKIIAKQNPLKYYSKKWTRSIKKRVCRN